MYMATDSFLWMLDLALQYILLIATPLVPIVLLYYLGRKFKEFYRITLGKVILSIIIIGYLFVSSILNPTCPLDAPCLSTIEIIKGELMFFPALILIIYSLICALFRLIDKIKEKIWK